MILGEEINKKNGIQEYDNLATLVSSGEMVVSIKL